MEHIVLVFISDEVDSQAVASKPTTATDPVQVRLRMSREVEIDHNVDCHDIDTASEQISAHEAASVAILEVVVDPVSICLLHS